MDKPLNIEISLLDKVFSKLFTKCSQFNGHTEKNMCNELLGGLYKGELLMELEKWLNRNNCNWMKQLDSLSPFLTHAERQLIMLLYLKFSSTSIAFLTERPSKQAVHTATCRLRRHLASINHESKHNILSSLRLE